MQDFLSPLASLVEIRKELEHLDDTFVVRPKQFLVYNPLHNPDYNLPKFHFMSCDAVQQHLSPSWRRTSNTDGNFIMYNKNSLLKEVNHLQVCGACCHQWNDMFPNNRVNSYDFNIENFFARSVNHQEIWGNLINNLPPEMSVDVFRPGCFLLYKPVQYAPFHFMKCSDIRDKEQSGWIKAYRFTDNISGFFNVIKERFNRETNVYTVEEFTQRLKPCKNCLSEWNWKNYRNVPQIEQYRIIENFNITEFFDVCANDENCREKINELYELMENNTVRLGSDIYDNYPSNSWYFISRMYRIAHRYRCEQCGVDLSAYAHSREHGDLLVVHHVNGSHPDVGANNMKVLCKECHSKQPYHENTVYRNNPASQAQRIADHNLLNNLRRSQGLSLLPDP